MAIKKTQIRNKPTKEIKLENGWNPNFPVGTKVVARKQFYTINAHDVFEYQGGCDHPGFDWAIILKDCDLTIPAHVFEEYFLQIV